MRQDSRKTTANMITMEEYLKKRQAMRKRRPGGKADAEERLAAALKLAEILCV